MNEENWKSFEIINYRDVILFFLLSKFGNDPKSLKTILRRFFKDRLKDEPDEEVIEKMLQGIRTIRDKYHKLIVSISKYNGIFKDIRKDSHLKLLHNQFFGAEFQQLSAETFNLLISFGYYKRTMLFLRIANNIRQNGNPCDSESVNIDSIYLLAHLINRLIKAKKHINKHNGISTRIVIDSLRNSLEIMFFKERYSGFYMFAVKDNKTRSYNRLYNRLVDIECPDDRRDLTNKLLDVDDIEYRTNDFSEGKFYAPDVENCIQKSDVHIINRKIQDIIKTGEISNEYENFYTREEQLMKIMSLVAQPGIVTPSSIERSMHIAHTAKSNSGCISRQVGAAITDENYSLRSIGWNDVAAGFTPCNLRSVMDYYNETLDEEHYSDFERGVNIDETDFKYKDKHPNNFKHAIHDYFQNGEEKIKNGMDGKNCSFCFKTIHNKYEGEKNQVHTRSLHAEENAMLQISKYGGQPLKGGKLFTTASPCELCAKKAFQLGIKEIFYIDPYPGISRSQILKSGKIDQRPKMLPFKGVIGKSYSKFYEPFMAYKDEVNMILSD